tara:strand:+ start:1573 stop:1755 length:183 start_codon:yes stop_codon:yes gene_type:complete
MFHKDKTVIALTRIRDYLRTLKLRDAYVRGTKDSMAMIDEDLTEIIEEIIKSKEEGYYHD